jgi:hypothetical protein
MLIWLAAAQVDEKVGLSALNAVIKYLEVWGVWAASRPQMQRMGNFGRLCSAIVGEGHMAVGSEATHQSMVTAERY